MKKVVITLVVLLATIAFSGIAIADTTADQIKKEGVAAEKIPKRNQGFKDKKKADVNVKKIKKSSACCEPDPIMPSSTESVGKGR